MAAFLLIGVLVYDYTTDQWPGSAAASTSEVINEVLNACRPHSDLNAAVLTLLLFSKLLFYCGGRIANPIHRALQLFLRHPEMFGPISNLVVFTHRDFTAVGLAYLGEIIRHRKLSNFLAPRRALPSSCSLNVFPLVAPRPHLLRG